MWLKSGLAILSFILLKQGECIVDKFNASLQDYSLKEDTANSSDVQTLQKHHLARYADFAPVRNPIRFKETPDNALSSSSHSRLLHHDSHHGYDLLDYDDSPHYGHGYEYHIHEPDHDHGYGHHSGHHDSHHYGHHHLSYGHHHKHVDHTLAAKTVLWPIAGIALLGAAAALVSNPVLLQLGVVSGRRKRREAESHELYPDFIKNWSKTKQDESKKINIFESYSKDFDVPKDDKRHFVKESKRQVLKKPVINKFPSKITVKRNLGDNLNVNYKESDDEKHFIRIPLKTND